MALVLDCLQQRLRNDLFASRRKFTTNILSLNVVVHFKRVHVFEYDALNLTKPNRLKRRLKLKSVFIFQRLF